MRRAEFPNPEEQCPDLRAGRQAATQAAPPTPLSTPAPPPAAEIEPELEAGRFWSGFALGAEEAGALLWAPETRLFTLMGGRDRGKTCWLTAAYILLANGFTDGFPYRFCGSRSLHGFQRLSDPAFKWSGPHDRILPRTTQASLRQPSFLHLAFKPRSYSVKRTTHVLLTDMPGEWFQNWADDGSRALPETLEFLPRTDGFLLAVDAQQAVADRAYRKDVRYLLDRTVALAQHSQAVRRPIAIVLTKYDAIVKKVPVPSLTSRKDPAAWGPLEPSLRSLVTALGDLPSGTPWDIFPTAAFSRPAAQPVGVLAPLAFLLDTTTRPMPLEPRSAPREYRGDFFEVFRSEGL
ncbi:MAG: hypothetical protein R3B70_39410 [Polyangiaceae bacterium]